MNTVANGRKVIANSFDERQARGRSCAFERSSKDVAIQTLTLNSSLKVGVLCKALLLHTLSMLETPSSLARRVRFCRESSTRFSEGEIS
jgi:hypothetical protein